MYEEFFGLNKKAFELVPNPEFLYLSKSHKKALSYLKYGLQENAGFILLSGEVGSGKTTLMRNIIRGFGHDTAVAMISNTSVTSKQILAMINEEFGLNIEGKDKVALIRDLNDHLIALHSRKVRPVVVIDEAQNLSAATLEEIRLLSNLEADCFKLLQIILVGQPELKEVIAQPNLRQLRQRIGINCHLEPLGRAEMEEYIYHRLATAGNRDALSFGEGAFDVIFDYSQGVPRLVNLICDFLLLSAFVEETRELTRELVEDVVGDVDWNKFEKEPVQGGAQEGGESRPLGGLTSRLARLEEGLRALEFVKDSKDQLEERLGVHETLLTRILERQDGLFLAAEKRMKQILRQLEALKQDPPPEPEPEPDTETMDFESPRKGFFARLFC